MQKEFLLSDFINLQSSLNHDLVEETCDLLTNIYDVLVEGKKFNPHDLNDIILVNQYQDNITKLCDTMSMIGIDFDNKDHKRESVILYVKMMESVYNGRQNYLISKLHYIKNK